MKIKVNCKCIEKQVASQKVSTPSAKLSVHNITFMHIMYDGDSLGPLKWGYYLSFNISINLACCPKSLTISDKVTYQNKFKIRSIGLLYIFHISVGEYEQNSCDWPPQFQ